MPFWYGYCGADGGGFWWLFPVFGLIVMGVMVFACFRGFGRGFGCMSRRAGDDIAELRRELQELKDDVKTLLQHPN